MAEDWQHGGFGLYVHWPFCEAKCPYCDFNSHVTRFVDHDRWRAAFISELRRVRAEIGPRVLNSIFFGGGTPSLMDPATVEAVITEATHLWTPANDIEITLEANPGSVERTRFRAFADGGVNRISMGIQALNDPDLKRLGRIHSRDDALAAFDIARDTFDRVSFDLIYARQEQSLEDWQAELSEAMHLAVDHLSLYQLTIEAGTAFGDRYARGGLKGLPTEDLGADLYDVTQTQTSQHNFQAYEVSNHAKPGSESRHNLIYWSYGDYAGIGPGAHGRLTRNGTRTATESYRMPSKWLDHAEVGNGYSSVDMLSQTDQASEFLLMGLRLYKGIDLTRYNDLSATALPTDILAEFADMSLIDVSDTTLRATPKGMPVLNHILSRLLV